MKKVSLGQKVITENQRLALENRRQFARAGSMVINLVSSPGSGKTSLIEETVKRLKADWSILVLTGDLMTENDALRIRGHGVEALQISTGEACHLDATMVSAKLATARAPRCMSKKPPGLLGKRQVSREAC